MKLVPTSADYRDKLLWGETWISFVAEIGRPWQNTSQGKENVRV